MQKSLHSLGAWPATSTSMDVEKKRVLNEILMELSSKNPGVYYMATTEVADLIVDYLKSEDSFPGDKKKKVKDLSQEEIQYLLSFDDRKHAR